MSEAFHNFWLIVSKPDNVPIVLMMILVIFYCWLAYKQARRNDRMGIYEATQADKVQLWPYLVKIEFLVTIIVMGSATFLVGLLPTYEKVGMVAPILLRVGTHLAGLAPAPLAAVSRRFGSHKIQAQLAEAHRSKR